MDEKEILTKIAYSKDGFKLGEIIAIEGSATAQVAIARPHAIILQKRFFGRNSMIPLLVDNITEIKDNTVVFDLLQSDFQLKVTNYHHQKKAYKKSKQQKFQERLQKDVDRGYYYKKGKGEW